MQNKFDLQNQQTTTGMLQIVLGFDFSGDNMTRLAEYEECIERYERTNNSLMPYDVVSGLLLKAVQDATIKRYLVGKSRAHKTWAQLRAD